MTIDRSQTAECSVEPCRQEVDDAPDMIRRYKMICELGQIVTSEMNLEALFGLIIGQTVRIMGSERASVFLHDPVSGMLCSWASTDLKTNAIRISPDCGVAGWVFRAASPLIINDPYNDPRFYRGVDRKTGFRTRNILCTPLVNRDRQCIGTLQALNKKAGEFDEKDLELLTAASYYVTIALENARLYEDLKALDKAKERVINHLSHEIKTPLSILSSVLRSIEKKAADGNLAGLRKTLLRGERNANRLKALQEQIDDILRCQQIDADCAPDICRAALDLLEEVIDEAAESQPEIRRTIGDRLQSLRQSNEYHFEPIRAAPFLQGVCDRAKKVMSDREICLIQEFDEEAVIHTDRGVLDKVCTGLLKNAIENTPDEGTVEVALKSRENETRITFTDHGVGITPVNQEMIFSGFFHTQATEIYSSKKPFDFNAGGTGADLLRIKSFAKRFGFEVRFESLRCPHLPLDRDICPGRISACRKVASKEACLSNSGSTFVVRFPVEKHWQSSGCVDPDSHLHKKVD